MILKFQQGGASLPPLTSYEPVTVTGGGTSAGTTTASTKSADSSDLTDKDILKMLEKLDGLPNDMQLIESELQNFYINQQYGINTSSIESRYLSILRQMKEANFHKAQYNEAFNVVKSNGGINEIAIDERGNLICVNNKGDFKIMSIEDLKKSEGYTPLTNSELLQFRAHNPEIAFNNNLLSIVSNGIGINTVTNIINNVISKLGSSQTTEEGYINTDSKRILKGLQDFKQACQETHGDFNPTIDNLYKYKIIDKSMAQQMKEAFSYIYKTLPENAKTLLKYKAGGVEGGLEMLIGQLITSQSSDSTEFTLSIDIPNAKTSKGESSKTANGFDMDPVSMLQAGYGQKETITIQTAAGGNRGIQVNTVRMPIVTKEGGSIGTSATLNDVSESAFAGYLNFENASMGGAMISTNGFNNIAVNGTALYTAYLPVDMEEYNATGNIKPDIDMLGKYKEVQNKIAEQGITDKEEINNLYQQANLPIMYDENGDVLQNYIKFGMINATALSTAFKEDADYADWLFETRDENEINNVLNIINKGRNKEDRIQFDAPSWWDDNSFIFNSSDHMYTGTVFIPVNTDHFTATAATGKYPTTLEAETIEAKQQGHARAQFAQNNYVNPGQL